MGQLILTFTKFWGDTDCMGTEKLVKENQESGPVFPQQINLPLI